MKQSNRERDAIEHDYDRALGYVRGKKVLTKTGKKDKVSYEEKEE